MRICRSGFSKTNKGSESVLTTILTIYRSGLRGNYGLVGTKKHGVRTKKHEKARKMRQKTDVVRFGTKIRGSSILPTPTTDYVENNPNILLLGESFGLFVFFEYPNFNSKK